jgi:hypothetical protein
MIFRVATLNLEQDHKCWEARRDLIAEQFGKLLPGIWALNEIHIVSDGTSPKDRLVLTGTI